MIVRYSSELIDHGHCRIENPLVKQVVHARYIPHAENKLLEFTDGVVWPEKYIIVFLDLLKALKAGFGF